MKKFNLFRSLAMVFAVMFIIGCSGGGSGSDDDNTPNPPPVNNEVPTASDLRRCTLCDDGKIFDDNLWLGEKFGEKTFYVVTRAEKANQPQKIYIGGVAGGKFIVHNQRSFAGEVTPEILSNLFGASFYKFGAIETIDPKISGDIEAVGLMTKSPFRKDLIDPAKVGSNEKCGLPFPVNNKNWQIVFPLSSLFYSFDSAKGKVKFNKMGAGEVITSDCQRGLSAEKRLEAQSLLPLGPQVQTTDGTVGGEIINANPPVRTSVVPPIVDPPVVDPPVIDPPVVDPPIVDPPVDPPVILPDPVLGSCQNDTYLVDPKNEVAYNFQDSLEKGKLFAEVNLTNPATRECKIKVGLKVSDVKIVTIRCWKIFIPAGWKSSDGNPVDLNTLNLGFSFSEQYQPQNGGDINTIMVGIVDSSCYSSYPVGERNWQSQIEELTVFAEVNRLHIDSLYKIKLNVRYGNMVFTFDCRRDVKEIRPWSAAVLKEHLPNYVFTFQGIPNDAYHEEDTVWIATSAQNKPVCIK